MFSTSLRSTGGCTLSLVSGMIDFERPCLRIHRIQWMPAISLFHLQEIQSFTAVHWSSHGRITFKLPRRVHESMMVRAVGIIDWESTNHKLAIIRKWYTLQFKVVLDRLDIYKGERRHTSHSQDNQDRYYSREMGENVNPTEHILH